MPRYGRDRTVQQEPCSPPNFQTGEIWDHVSARASVESAHGAGSRPAWLVIFSACCGLRPAQHLWLQPRVRGHPKALLGGEIQRGEEPPRHTHTGKHRVWRGDWPETPRRAVAGGSSTLLLCSRGHGLARSRIQAQGPTFAQAAKPKQSWSSPSPGREARELLAWEPASAAHAGVGRGAGQQTGTRGALQASGKGCLRGASRRKGVQEKTSQGGSLCPQPLSVTTSSVEQIYIKNNS